MKWLLVATFELLVVVGAMGAVDGGEESMRRMAVSPPLPTVRSQKSTEAATDSDEIPATGISCAPAGRFVRAPDGCNRCFCGVDGQLTHRCTRAYCPPGFPSTIIDQRQLPFGLRRKISDSSESS